MESSSFRSVERRVVKKCPPTLRERIFGSYEKFAKKKL